MAMFRGNAGKSLVLAAVWLSAACSSDGTTPPADGTGGDPGIGGKATGGDVSKPSGGSGGSGAAAGRPTTGGTGGTGGTGNAPTGGTEPGTPTGLSDEVPAELAESLQVAATTDGNALRERYGISLKSELAYDPMSATNLDLIQNSALALRPADLEKLAENGFVISRTQEFPTFTYGYKTIYSEDLPLYVSADSILFALHRSFDELLKRIEESYLRLELDNLLASMRGRLASSDIDASLRADVDLYLTLAQSLLRAELLDPGAGADATELRTLYDLATKAEGHREVTWFGSSRDEDFSQFKPRGHYTHSVELAQYFRAMMLLGRVDLRLIETQGDGSQVFHRKQFDAAVALNDLLGDARSSWTNVDSVIGSIVGERDSMSPNELEGMLEKLAATDFASTRSLSDDTIVEELARGGWGAQRIASRIIIKESPGPTLPLDRSFALFGQRYTVDSHVFVNTTFDRVDNRMMPDPLDVAFAALGNDSALDHLATELDANASYAAGLAKTRTLVDAHEPAYWEGSVYTDWLSALRVLSPTAESLAEQPSLFSTRAQQDRILNTQLASWAELRHDTILYAKQSYTAGNTCEFPDAYVDPYPEFYARLGRVAQRVNQVVDMIPSDDTNTEFVRSALRTWAADFTTVMGYLERMAENQTTGTPHDDELMEFINQAVNWDEQFVCGDVVMTNLSGWYLKLIYGSPFEEDPTIADVHTQPTDEGGADVGRILHVGTGRARLMVTTIETCMGPRAYAGLASSYSQVVEEDWKRLNDPEWKARINAGDFTDAPWLEHVLGEE
jgi:hypothetical protein